MSKNQILITTLALMVAVAGYLNYSGAIFPVAGEEVVETNNDLVNQELLDISDEDVLLETESDIESLDTDLTAGVEEKEGTPGEAVLTSGGATETIAAAKVSREQVRASSKETLQAIIDNDQLENEQKEIALNQLMEMTYLAELEVTIETLLAAKGFDEVVVTLIEDAADVVVAREELSDANRAQIEDIVIRKTGIAAEKIVITPIQDME